MKTQPLIPQTHRDTVATAQTLSDGLKEGYLTASHKLRWLLEWLEAVSASRVFNAACFVQSLEAILLNFNTIRRDLGRISRVFRYFSISNRYFSKMELWIQRTLKNFIMTTIILKN